MLFVFFDFKPQAPHRPLRENTMAYYAIHRNTVEATYEGRLYKGTAAYKGTL